MTFSEEVRGDYRDLFVARVVAETGDALAAIGAIDDVPEIDASKIAMMGWSFGALVSVFAAARTDRLFAIINQAGGSLNWQRSSPLRDALEEAAGVLTTPTFCMVAEERRHRGRREASPLDPRQTRRPSRARGLSAVHAEPEH